MRSRCASRWSLGLAATCFCLAWGFGQWSRAVTHASDVAEQRRTIAASVMAPRTQAPAPASSRTQDYQAVVAKYCVTCHNDRLKTGGLVLSQLDATNPGSHGEQWEKVVRKLRVGTMPPVGMPRPDAATYTGMIEYLETALDRAAANHGSLARSLSMHRLNRAEYGNAIRDVLGLEVDVASLFLPDDSSFGFDNIADALVVSPALQERYLSAANKIAALAIGDVSQLQEPEERTFVVPPDLTQLQHQEGLPLGTRGGRLFRMNFPVDGEYQFKAKLWRTNQGGIRGMDVRNTFIITLDGREVFRTVVGGPEDQAEIRKNSNLAQTAIEGRLQIKIPVEAGPHDVGVAFVFKSDAERPTTLMPYLATLDPADVDGAAKIDRLSVNGPFNVLGPGETPSRRKIFECRPKAGVTAEELTCARRILSTVARRAYRRPVNERDLERLMQFYSMGASDGTFDTGIGLGLTYILSSPEFVFRVERDPANLAPGALYQLSDSAIATRLSFFLWSSVPDDQLLNVAARGRLKDPVVLAQQVKRMLADPKANALTTNFAGQWLWVRNLNKVSPNNLDFPEFDRNTRESMATETEMFFKSIVDENRSVLDLLNANYTFLNERLAKHYGIKGVYGSQFRRVSLTDPNRFGLLGQGSFLTVTSNPNRTSPVNRGKWVLENLLGTPPPPPPPGVPPLATEEGDQRPRTLREEMEAHRGNPVCASCHNLMDPIGFALDNFDGVGQWRTVYPGTTSSPGTKIDATGRLADGTPIDGPISLRQALTRRPENFVITMTEKLMTYALGRGLEYYDMPAVRKIVRNAAREDYRFQTLVMGIVTSPQFQMRRATEPDAPAAKVVQQSTVGRRTPVRRQRRA